MSLWIEPFLMEQEVAKLISDQALYGCNFDSRGASWHAYSISEKIAKIDIQLIPMLPKMMHKSKTHYKEPFKLNGDLKSFVQKYVDKVGGISKEVIGGPFTPVWYTSFDPSKIAKVKDVMLDNGWVPAEWNNKKQLFDGRKSARLLKRRTYSQYLDRLTEEDREIVEGLTNTFLKKHFKGHSVGYMYAILRAMGFPKNTKPSVQAIKRRLMMSQYWVTSPKINPDEDEWETSEDNTLGELLRQRMQLSHKKGLLQGLLKVVRPDGKIPAEANSCATPTARFKHRKVVNIPAGRALYGKQCRSLFIGDRNPKAKAKIIKFRDDKNRLVRRFIPKGQDTFVGGDASGLELRVLTHYLIQVCSQLLEEATEASNHQDIVRYREALKSAYSYRETLLEGDIHSYNQKLAGLPTRDAAKSFIYAFNYGAGNAKLGSLVGGGAEEGAKMRATFLKECPCISVLIEWAQQYAGKNGWLPALDGRKLIMRKDEDGNVQSHKALNTLLQAGGSIVVKKATLILDKDNKEENVGCNQVIHMH